MKDIIKKLITAENSISTLSKKIIIHGVQLASGLILIALILFFINIKLYHYDFNVEFITFCMIENGVTIFAEAIIGGLLIDFLIKKYNDMK